MVAPLLSLLIAAAPAGHAVPVHRVCPLPPGTPVDVAVTPLQQEALGGAIRPEPPLTVRATRLRFGWGYRFLPRTPLFAHFDVLLGPMAMGHARSGCWFSWGPEPRSAGLIHVKVIDDPSRELPGPDRGRPDWIPGIAGFRFVAANHIARPPFAWIGVWRATRRPARSRIVAFTSPGAPQKLLIELPFAAGALTTLPDPHGVVLGIDVIEDNVAGSEARVVRLDWIEPRPPQP